MQGSLGAWASSRLCPLSKLQCSLTIKWECCIWSWYHSFLTCSACVPVSLFFHWGVVEGEEGGGCWSMTGTLVCRPVDAVNPWNP